MGQITSSVGIISGINTGAIIDGLMALDEVPVTLLQNQINSANSQMQAYQALEPDLQSLQTIAQTLQKPQTFQATTANSSNPNVLTATTTAGASQGNYQFQVAQLVSAQQSISGGYNSTSAPLQAGNLTIEMGGGNLNPQTPLANLNGGQGITRGQFRITDAAGNSDVINTSTDVNLDDVVNQINNSLDINVHAAIVNNHLVITDNSTGSGTLSIQDIGGGTSAQSLGIAGNATGNTLTGSAINYLSTNTPLSALNDGRGIQTTTGSGDFAVTAADGTSFSVSLTGAQTVGDVVNDINKASNGKVKASIASGSSGITLTDTSGGSGSTSVADIDGSHAAQDLGIAQSSTSGSITGSPIIAGLDTVLVNSLEGGSGVALGTFNITDKAGTTTAVNLSGVTTVQGILDAINNATSGSVTASLNSAGNGIQLQDNSSGSGNLSVADTNGGTTAQTLGLAGTFSTGSVDGGDLHLQYVTQNTLLSTYDGGAGVGTGTFQITNSAGGSATVDLSSGTFNTIGDVISAINAKNIGVTASINSTGNGILLTDTSNGAGHLTVTDVTGTSAANLNIAGTATGTTINGALEKTIQVTSSDTLATLQNKINQAGFGVTANIINDGSSESPYHLSLTAVNSGSAGRVVVDGGTTGLQFRNLVNAQDAAVFVGGAGSTQPLLVTSSTNQVTNVIPGVTLSLLSASSTPVDLSVTADGSSISSQLQSFTTTFNDLVTKLNTYTSFNTTTDTGGVLLGDPTALQIQNEMYTIFSSVSNAGSLRTVGDVGLTLTTGAQAQFDSSTFNSAFAQNPQEVQQLFTQATTGLATVLNNAMTSLVDPVSGAITLENKTLTTQTTDFQSQITQLDSILTDKRNLLQEQFNNMESVLAGLQSQQEALSSLGTLASSKVGTTNSSAAASSSTGSGSSTSGSSSASGG